MSDSEIYIMELRQSLRDLLRLSEVWLDAIAAHRQCGRQPVPEIERAKELLDRL